MTATARRTQGHQPKGGGKKPRKPTTGTGVQKAKAPGTAVMIRQEGNTPASATATMIALAQSKDFDAVKFQALALFQENMVTQQARIDFVEAQHAMQPKLPEIRADGRIEIDAKRVGAKAQSTPYATLANINRVIKPILHEYGFVLTHRNDELDGKVVVNTTLARGLHQIESRFVGQVEASGSKNNVQGTGSTISYGRRYNTISLLNLTTAAKADFDDNGIGGGIVEDDTPKIISDEQFKTLEAKITSTGADRMKFRKHFGIETIRDLPVADYDKAIKMLDQKAAQ